MKTVSRAAHSMYQRLGKRFVDLVSQSADVRFYHICVWVKMVVPNSFQKHVSGDDPVSVFHEIGKQPEFAGLQ